MSVDASEEWEVVSERIAFLGVIRHVVTFASCSDPIHDAKYDAVGEMCGLLGRERERSILRMRGRDNSHSSVQNRQRTRPGQLRHKHLQCSSQIFVERVLTKRYAIVDTNEFRTLKMSFFGEIGRRYVVDILDT